MDKTAELNFEHLMNEGVRLHGEKHYEIALALSTMAYSIAPDGTFEKGRAARDNSARCDRLGWPVKAEEWAMEAYSIHNAIAEGMSELDREAYRERSVSAMYVGITYLRKVIGARENTKPADGNHALDFMRRTWSDLEMAKTHAKGINRWTDQYEINAARRVSMAESLLGNKRAGLRIGARAVAISFLSESPRLDTATPNLSPRQRRRAKGKAFLGGVAAVGAGVLSIPSSDLSRKLALSIAEKTL